ncbi:uncharacterized protein EI90DRAFT_847307 [Cantharellus anzutake]|uniref:uncharacterized protein n=1 Tax=Cantharellus anzutake TaxID=1750568 RepID=UPI00190574B7|nr:uncharacterized protein EI90DRAFT_847307 [Cantharellus anzutake]KAF8332324.1 hypothetical protein EI90DRAFT_847307 [Cantharellus anzutake]
MFSHLVSCQLRTLLDLRIRRLRYACAVTIRPECPLLACSSPMRDPIHSPSCLLVDRCIRQNMVLRLPFHMCMQLASYRTDIHQFVLCFHLPTGFTIGLYWDISMAAYRMGIMDLSFGMVRYNGSGEIGMQGSQAPAPSIGSEERKGVITRSGLGVVRFWGDFLNRDC